MLKRFLLILAMLGATNHSLAGLMTYEGSGAFKEGGTFTFMFDWDDTVAEKPVNASVTTQGGPFPDFTYTTILTSSFGITSSGIRLFETLFSESITGGGFRNFRLSFSPWLDSVTMAGLGGTETYTTAVGDSTSRFVVEGSAMVVPAPATMALIGIGLAGLGWSRRKAQTELIKDSPI